MAFLRVSEARSAAGTRAYNLRAASQTLAEHARAFSQFQKYDVFLSHAYQDADVILGVKTIIESLGLTVYVDWLEDGGLDRSQVTAKTAEILRARMRQSASLAYVHTAQSPDSKWMPWELGYFDGFKPNFVWILPLVTSYDSEFKRQEYLGLYPTVDKLAALPGRLSLGFPDVQHHGSPVTLAEAAKGQGVYLTSR
jgi:hypothetical protein